MADRYYDRDDRREPDYGRADRPREGSPGRHDRDFFERAGDEVRSWFGDEDAAHRREIDERRMAREREAETARYGWRDRPHDEERDVRGERWRDRRDDDWRGRPDDEWTHRRAPGLYTGSLDDRDWGPRPTRREAPPSRYFTSERWHTSGRGRGDGDDDRRWVGGGPDWGREYGWGPGSRGNDEQSSRVWTGRFTGRGPRGYQRSDERIREDVCDRLTVHGDIDASNVEVEVVGAEVTLRGTVDSRGSRRLAEDVAEAVPGVRHVHNEIRVGHAADASGTGGASGGFNAGPGGVAVK